MVYPHKLFSTVSICGQVLTMNKQFISSTLRPTCFTYLKTDCVLKSMASQSPWTMAVVDTDVTACAGGNLIKTVHIAATSMST